MSPPSSVDGMAEVGSEWGVLAGDAGWRHLDLDDDDGQDEAELRDAREAHEWPSEIRYYAESSFSIPGKGEQPESCGAVYPLDVCESCGSLNYRESTCENRSCPNCWRAWTRRRAEAISVRLGAARMTEDDGIRRRAVHAVASPPPGSVKTIEDVKQMKKEAYARAKDAGVRGGVAVVHGWRVKDEFKSLFRALKEQDEVSGGIWKWVRENQKAWREQVEWSPHVHIIGLSTEFEADTGEEGWRVRRLSTLDSMDSAHDESAYESMVGVSMYLLSHAAIESEGSTHTLTWFGELATAKFSPEKAVSEGMLSTIERYARETAAPEDSDEDGEGVGRLDEDERLENECAAGTEGCSGSWDELVSIWNVPRLLRDEEWCDRVGDDRVDRVEVAFEWMIGELQPPPSMRYPEDVEQAEEVVESML